MKATRRQTLLLGLAAPAFAQPVAWTQRPIRLVVPFAAGGPSDAVARLVMDGASQALGGRITIENRAGAGVIVGTQAVAQAPADGTTFLWTTVAHAVAPAVAAQLPYDPDRDFRGVALSGTVALILVVPAASPYRNLSSLLAAIRAEPGVHTYGTAGIGSAQHLGGALLAATAGLVMNAVPYRGNPSAVTDLAAGRLSFVAESAASTLPLVQAGTLRALAVTGAQRLPELPGVPTIAEAAIPGFEAYTWNAVLARRETPEEAVAGMNNVVNVALRRPDLAVRLAALGVLVTADTTPATTDRFLADQAGKWRPLLASLGIRPE